MAQPRMIKITIAGEEGRATQCVQQRNDFITIFHSIITDPAANAGVYALSTINGTSLPFTETASEGGTSFTLRVNSGSTELRSDGTFTQTMSFTASFGDVSETVSSSVQGTWTINGTTASLIATSIRVNGETQTPDRTPVSAQLSGGRLTIVDSEPSPVPHTLVFVR